MPTKPQITIGSTVYDVAAGSLSVSCGAELSGATLTATLKLGSAVPQCDEKVDCNVGGLHFIGRLNSRSTQGQNKGVLWQIQATGYQEWLQRGIGGDFAGAASAVCGDLLDGTPVGAVVVGEDREIAVTATDTVANALGSLADNGYITCLRPDGTLRVVDRTSFGTPDYTITHGDAGVQSITVSESKNLGVTQVVIRGTPTRDSATDDDVKTFFEAQNADGTAVDFKYPDECSTVTAVFLDGSQLSLVEVGHVDESSAQCVNHKKEKFIHFNTTPTSGAVVKIEYEIEYVLSTADDTATQSIYAGRFGGDGVVSTVEQRSEIATNAAGDAVAAAALANRPASDKSASIDYWGATTYYPGDVVQVVDSRAAWNETMVVSSVNYKWDLGLSRWRQSLSLSNGKTKGMGSIAGRLGSGKLTTGRIPGTVYSPGSGDYTVSVSPSTETITGSGDAEYTVTVTPSGGFIGHVDLSVTGLDEMLTAVFDPETVNITDASAKTSTLTITLAEGDLECE